MDVYIQVEPLILEAMPVLCYSVQIPLHYYDITLVILKLILSMWEGRWVVDEYCTSLKATTIIILLLY